MEIYILNPSLVHNTEDIVTVPNSQKAANSNIHQIDLYNRLSISVEYIQNAIAKYITVLTKSKY